MNTFKDLEPMATCVVQCNEGTFFEKEKNEWFICIYNNRKNIKMKKYTEITF
jgi:hypothetical protein